MPRCGWPRKLLLTTWGPTASALDVKERNTRAQALYASEGFALEGRLRESVKVSGGYDSLIVMSMLQPEFAARRTQGLEMFA